VRELVEERHTSHPEQLGMLSQQAQGSHRVRTRPAERHAVFGRQRLGQHEIAVERVGEAERRRDPERQAWIEAAEHAAERWPEHEACPEGNAEHAKARRALVRGRHIRNVGVGC